MKPWLPCGEVFSWSVCAREADTLDKQKDLTFSPSVYKHYVLFKVFLSQCWVINRSLLCMLNLPANLEAVEEEGSYGLARWRPSVSPYTRPCAAGAKPAPAD